MDKMQKVIFWAAGIIFVVGFIYWVTLTILTFWFITHPGIVGNALGQVISPVVHAIKQ